jgi:hypothetical protein
MDYTIEDSDRPLPLPPEGHPLRRLGERLAELLDEDQWAECEAMLLEGWERDRIDRKTGEAWRTNSSLEVWFPITSERLKPLDVTQIMSMWLAAHDSVVEFSRRIEFAHGIHAA